jgi:hypothetical protein
VAAPDAGPWRIERLVLDSGESPVQTFLEGLTGEDRADAFALLELLAESGNGLRMPHSKPLGGGLFELRGRQVRIFYVFRRDRRAVLLDGLVKKRGDIPSTALKRVRRHQRQLEAAEAREQRGRQGRG